MHLTIAAIARASVQAREDQHHDSIRIADIVLLPVTVLVLQWSLLSLKAAASCA
jgi:hypothetical protein